MQLVAALQMLPLRLRFRGSIPIAYTGTITSASSVFLRASQ